MTWQLDERVHFSDFLKIQLPLRQPFCPMQSAPELAKLALHLFAMVPNSASAERLFSDLGCIQSDRRTRLTVQRMMDLACIKGSLPVRKRCPPNFEVAAHYLRSATSSAAPPSEEEVQAAVREGEEQLASEHDSIVRKESQVDACLDEMEMEVSISFNTEKDR